MIGKLLDRFIGVKDDELRLPEDMRALIKRPYGFHHLVAKRIPGISDDYPEGDILGWNVFDRWTDAKGRKQSKHVATALFSSKQDVGYEEFVKYINRANRILPISRTIRDCLTITSLGASAVLAGVLLVDRLESVENSIEQQTRPTTSYELAPDYRPLKPAYEPQSDKSYVFDDNGVVIKLR